MIYGWQIEKITTKEKDSSKKDILEHEVYKEMLTDYYHVKWEEQEITKNQFKRALNHFSISNYKEELDMILYFGKLISHLNLELPLPSLTQYDQHEVVNLATTYMRRKEPCDYPYFKKIVKGKDRIQFSYITPECSFLGKSYFLNKNNYYILINSVNGIQDTITLLHESAHIENYLKYEINLSKFYAELSSMTREHYGFDLLKIYDDGKEVEKQRMVSLNHYLLRIIKLYNALLLVIQLQKRPNDLKQVINNFEHFSSLIDVSYLYHLLLGTLEKEMDYALSFIASLDIYSNCSPKESHLFITSYQIGTRKVSRDVIERVTPYLLTMLEPYQKVKIL